MLLICISVSLLSYGQRLNDINGKVLSENGEPLGGATITIENSTKGAQQHLITDDKGLFTLSGLSVNDKYNLLFEFVGYQPEQINNYVIAAGQNSALLIRMKPQKNSLDEVVVVGYGTQKKGNVIGAISQITAKDVNNRAVTQASQALTGQMPGITVTQRSGQPGGASGGTIRVRGSLLLGPAPMLWCWWMECRVSLIILILMTLPVFLF